MEASLPACAAQASRGDPQASRLRAWLDVELRRWRAAGHRATLWWRDDDRQPEARSA